mmetsp:Transcript_22676/g.31578  ORF Transcript_22676/g.31578 Transcript_22676/m.31578 type:complete len:221 (-) Transcript_22676:384-1046(-)|eukprot:CAMPEP_0168548410 /NCGR_PEP_ID=MMETSP0413-20121227/4543_1 /TAXON_ID=136452 /ORGANISM="Filamoeba nolandi, Strain NC-AS-23-1" /LENGTH=220 /DNA_ID=CAMNT_0008578705 /DNA_START=153 /DNA_END=815 /DNA_ORIENTATION=+
MGSICLSIKNHTILLQLHGVHIKIGLAHNIGSMQNCPIPLELVKEFHPLFENALRASQKRDLELLTNSLKTIQTWKDPSKPNSLFVELMFQIDTLLEISTPAQNLLDTKGSNTRLRFESNARTESPFGPSNVVFKVPKNKPKNGAFTKQWKGFYVKLVKFKEQFGHANVTRRSKGWESLGGWVANQRRKLRKGKLTRQQYNLLNEVGIEWDRAVCFKGHP